MKQEDLAERALELLRHEHGPVMPDPALEARLRRRHAELRPARRARWPWIAGALALSAGASFAAAGGVEWLRRWWVRVEVDGRALSGEVDGDGARVFEVDTADGGRASVRVLREADAGGTRTRLAIDRVGPGRVDVERGEHATGDRIGAPLPLSVVDGLAPFYRGADGGLELFAIGDGVGGSRLLSRRPRVDPSHVRELARLPFDLLADGARAEITELADGGLALELTHGPGAEFALVLGPEDAATSPRPTLATPDGAVRVEVGDGPRPEDDR